MRTIKEIKAELEEVKEMATATGLEADEQKFINDEIKELEAELKEAEEKGETTEPKKPIKKVTTKTTKKKNNRKFIEVRGKGWSKKLYRTSRKIPKNFNFSDLTKEVTRPYLEFTEQDYDNLVSFTEKPFPTNWLKDDNGNLYTFGSYDSPLKWGLMPSIKNKKSTKKKTTVKKAAPKKSTEKKFIIFEGKKIYEDDENFCDSLISAWEKRKNKTKKLAGKRKTKPVLQKVAGNIAAAVSKGIKSIKTSEIKAEPKVFISKMEKLEKKGREFLDSFKEILGDKISQKEIKEEFDGLDKLIKELAKKYQK